MVEIYNEQVRDLLSSDGPQKRYPLIFFPLWFFFFFFWDFILNYKFLYLISKFECS